MKKTAIEPKKLSTSINPLSDLATEKTIFWILKKEGGIKKKVSEYLDWLRKEYPDAKESIDKVWNNPNTQGDWGSYNENTSREDWLAFVRYFTFDKTTIEKVKKGAGEKLDQLFLVNDSDSDTKKFLKSQATKGLKDDFAVNYKADQIAWAVELCRIFYLKAFPKYIDEGLKNEIPPLTLNDLKKADEEGSKKVRQELFTNLYSSWTTTIKENDINDLKKKLIESIVKFNNLISKAQSKISDDLKEAKEKVKKEISDLTQEEKDEIDKATDKQGLDKVVADIKDERNKFSPEDLTKANDWIEKNISSKIKLEELTATDEDIEKALGSLKLPKGFVENAKWILRKKRKELTPEPTTTEGKIKDLLVWFRDRVRDLKKGGITLEITEIEIKVFKKYWETKMDKVIPLVEKALKTDTLEGYKLLDEEWLNLKNKELNENNKNYNSEFDYFTWNTLRSHLEEVESAAKETKYNDLVDKIKSELGPNLGKEFLEIWELESKIEVKEKSKG